MQYGKLHVSVLMTNSVVKQNGSPPTTHFKLPETCFGLYVR